MTRAAPTARFGWSGLPVAGHGQGDVWYGAFALLHVGDRPLLSSDGMLTTIALQGAGVRSYAIEGSIFSAGTGVQWLRDGLGRYDTPPRWTA